MVEKKCPCDNTFGGREGFVGLQTHMKKKRPMKLFPTFEDAEKEVQKVPGKVWKVK